MRPVRPEWAPEIEAAQEFTYVRIAGKDYDRIPHLHDDTDRCGDCGAAPGQLHVPTCDQERCPCCSGQFLSCDCEVDP